MDLYIIAGPNGVGKTTFAREFLPNYAKCNNFVNADLIAQALAPFSPETAAVRAGRMMLHEIKTLAKKRASFAFETTLSGRGYETWLRELREQGYKIHIFFLCVENVDLSLSRVRERVSRGGHDIPEEVTRRRFDRSIRNFLGRYRRLADRWTLFDNSGTTPFVVAWGGDKHKRVRIINKAVYRALIKNYDLA
jgi:predicted ABC-type ATPase